MRSFVVSAIAAAAMTLEHFGCQEWWDDASGYHPTCFPEVSTVYTDTGRAFDTLTRSAWPKIQEFHRAQTCAES
jgi:hypothetical protein